MTKTYLSNGTITISVQEITEAPSKRKAEATAFDKLLRELDEFLTNNTEAFDITATTDEVKEYDA